MEDVDNHLPGFHSPVAYTPSGAHHAMGAQDIFLLVLNRDEKPTFSRFSNKRITKAAGQIEP